MMFKKTPAENRIKILEEQIKDKSRTNALLKKENEELKSTTNKAICDARTLSQQSQIIIDKYRSKLNELKEIRREYESLTQSIKKERKLYKNKMEVLFTKLKTKKQSR